MRQAFVISDGKEGGRAFKKDAIVSFDPDGRLVEKKP